MAPLFCLILLFSPVCLFTQHLTQPSQKNRTSFHCNPYRSLEMSFPKSTREGWGGPIGGARRDWSYRGGNWWCWGGGYLVPFVTRAGRISYRGLFVEETLRLWDSGIVRESPLADPLKREHGEKGSRGEGTQGGKLREAQREGKDLGVHKDKNLYPINCDK